MSPSAQFGQPPATQNDYYIVKALLSRSPKLAALDPAKGFPMQVPSDAPHDSGADRIYAGAIITIFFLLFITGIRVVTRRMAKPNALGWDDFFIILAAVRTRPTIVSLFLNLGPGLCVLMVRAGHWYDSERRSRQTIL